MTDPPSSLETSDLRKEYPGTVALRDVSLHFQGGSIHALLGKNGAGKSTLVKIIAGAAQPTSGTLRLNGRPVRFRTPREALTCGIATVYQELSIIPSLTVAENILLGRLPQGRSGLVDWTATCDRARAVLAELGVSLDVHARAGTLGVAHQQMVEIAKAMSSKPSVLLLDEPTSALAHQEIERLFGILRLLASRGVVLLYITHRLEEIHRIADTVTVLRDGGVIGTIGINEATPATIVRMMFGEAIRKGRPSPAPILREPVMEVRNFSRRNAFEDISFDLFTGEVLGLAGLLGSGRTELLRGLFGADPHDRGSVTIQGRTVFPSSPSQMKRLGMALAPEKRKEEGLVQLLSTRVNLCLASLEKVAGFGLATAGSERVMAAENIRRLDIAVSSMDAPVSALSGGSQQKVVIGKWLNTSPRVMLFDEPTRGIDIQAKQQIFHIIRELSEKGVSSIVVSSELEELMENCHRIFILKKGRMVGEILPHQSTLEQLITVCME